MALPPGFLEELRARTPLPALIGRRVRLTRSGRQWKGCCPFHGEKTPSFYVYDDHYHCFGCGAHGDGISFVMQSQGAGFMEAVEALAAEAGLDLPKPTPEAAAAEQRRHHLHDVLDAAARVFQRRLFSPEGAAALAYLHRRGLADETIRRFGLGWAGEGRGALAAELGRAGIGPELLAEGGLMKPPEDGAPAREFFFNRVIFPIRDRRGRPISFGGRVLGDGQPKYLNGPETSLFSKRRTLYGLDQAREGARQGATVLAVEGYMDVIALHQAGFPGAVAPLGTALTVEQLEEIWRLSPMAVLCFDGDAAGARAAVRAIMTALPLIGVERSLAFLPLPEGEDPDSYVRQRGAADFKAQLASPRPLQQALFDLLYHRMPKATPEQRAGLQQELTKAAGLITDKVLASEYRRALLDQFFAATRPARPGRSGPDRSGPNRSGKVFRPELGPRQPRSAPSRIATEAERMRCLTAILLRHPVLLHDVEEAYGQIELPPPLDLLRAALQRWSDAAEELDSAALLAHLTESGLAAETAQALSAVPLPLPGCAAPDAMPAEAEAGWWQLYGLTHRDRLEEEVAAASRAFATEGDAVTERRLKALAAAREALARGESGAEAEA
jgi:DNA primase